MRNLARPPRRYYALTAAGEAMAEAATERFPTIIGVLDAAARDTGRS